MPLPDPPHGPADQMPDDGLAFLGPVLSFASPDPIKESRFFLTLVVAAFFHLIALYFALTLPPITPHEPMVGVQIIDLGPESDAVTNLPAPKEITPPQKEDRPLLERILQPTPPPPKPRPPAPPPPEQTATPPEPVEPPIPPRPNLHPLSRDMLRALPRADLSLPDLRIATPTPLEEAAPATQTPNPEPITQTEDEPAEPTPQIRDLSDLNPLNPAPTRALGPARDMQLARRPLPAPIAPPSIRRLPNVGQNSRQLARPAPQSRFNIPDLAIRLPQISDEPAEGEPAPTTGAAGAGNAGTNVGGNASGGGVTQIAGGDGGTPTGSASNPSAPAGQSGSENAGNGGAGAPLPRRPRGAGARVQFGEPDPTTALGRMARSADCAELARDRDGHCPDFRDISPDARARPEGTARITPRFAPPTPTNVPPQRASLPGPILPVCPPGTPGSNLGVTCLPDNGPALRRP